jgi:dolichol-phosphate mannosyltransferase
MNKAIIIVPTYNERENVQQVVPTLIRVFKRVKHWQLGILIVDDNSPDGTADVVRELQKEHRQLYLLNNPKKAGLGGAYLKGMEYAFGHLKADVVFEFDADLSHDAEKIPDFLTAIDNGAEMVLGSRYMPGGSIPEDWGWHRKFLSVVGNSIIRLVLWDFRIRDWTGGYRAITKPVYDAIHKELNRDEFTGYAFQVGFLHKAVRRNYKIIEVPFHFVDRTIGESKMGADFIKNALLFLLKTRAKEILNHRLFKFAVVGGFGAFLQLSSLHVYRLFTPYLLASILSIETAVVSNFILNNIWTFKDRTLKTSELPGKFIAFNIASMGSIVIQYVIATVGTLTIGLVPLWQGGPALFHVDTGDLYAVAGILLGMIWNFMAYDRWIWGKRTRP